MNLRRARAMARKEALHVLRDPRALGISIALPLVLLMLFGYALTLDVDRVPFLLWDQSRTPESRDLAARLSGSPYFSLVARAGSYRDIEGAFDRGDAIVAVVIPLDYGRAVAAGRPTQVQILVDGSDANTAILAIGYAESIIRTRSQGLAAARLEALGRGGFTAPLEVRARVWFNTDMESRNFIVPGLIAVIMMLIAALLTSLTVAREWEQGTMEQLISTPVRGPEVILGKLAPYFAIGMLDMALSVLAGRLLFGVPLRGSILALFAMSAVYLVGALSLGILISTVAKNQLLASQVAFMATFLPAFLLSGFMFDVGNMPRAMQAVTYLVPARYFVTMLRGLYLKGVGPAVLYTEGLFLLLFGAATLALAVKKFEKSLD